MMNSYKYKLRNVYVLKAISRFTSKGQVQRQIKTITIARPKRRNEDEEKGSLEDADVASVTGSRMHRYCLSFAKPSIPHREWNRHRQEQLKISEDILVATRSCLGSRRHTSTELF
ncbi:uncharacterized protein [Apostichopus japonicus]|uniref:uncharacterized protein n=1 Tax=Stichopus japonicus TaxID=307972 RepID=UPI003AB56E09